MNLRSRSFRGAADHSKIQEFLQGQQFWETLPDYWHIGRSTLAIYLDLFDSIPSDHQLWEDGQGKIQACTWLSPEERTRPWYMPGERMWKIQIHPDKRSTELTTEMLLRPEAQLQARIVPQGETKQPLITVAYDKDEWFRSLLSAHNYSKGDCLAVYMRTSLDWNIPPPNIKGGFVVRAFEGETEIEQRAGAQSDAFARQPNPPSWMMDNIRCMMRHHQGREHIELVAVSGTGTIASFSDCLIDPVTKLGEFEGVGTRPSFQRQGLARAVMLAGLGYMQEKGMKNVVVRTEVDNAGAIGLYESIGFTVMDKLYQYVKTI